MKISLIIVFYLSLSFAKSSDLLDSKAIWKKVAEFKDNGIMDFDKNYFIFDLKDYATLYHDNEKRYAFTQKQKYLYDTYGINNYLFIVDDFDIDKETILTLTKNLQNYINTDYGISMLKSIILFIAIDRRKTRIEMGSDLNDYISDEYASNIIESMADYMRSEDYYNAFNKALNQIEYYYNTGKSGGGSSSSSTSSGGSSSISTIIILILVFLVLVAAIVYRCYTRGCVIGGGETYVSYSEPGYHSHNNYGGFHHSGGGYHKSGGGHISGGPHKSGGHSSGGSHKSGGHSSGGSHKSGGTSSGKSKGGGHSGGATGGW